MQASNSVNMSAEARNPFTVKVGQIMTGFGAGCGIGVGVGYPIALGSIPVLGEMVSATSSAGSRAFGGVGHKALDMLRKLGIKNLKAGVGCGIGIGHGFGVGIALKPGVSQQVVHSLQERLSAASSQLQKYLPTAETDTETAAEKLQPASPDESIPVESFRGNNVVAEAPDNSAAYVQTDASHVTKTEPVPRVSSRGNGEVGSLTLLPLSLSVPQPHFEVVPETESGSKGWLICRWRNYAKKMSCYAGYRLTYLCPLIAAGNAPSASELLRHQELIEDLKVQNASILRILSEQFDLQMGGQEMDPDRNPDSTQLQRVIRKHEILHAFHSHSHNSTRKCFECRMSARRRR